VREWGTDRSRVEVMHSSLRSGDLGSHVRIVPNNSVDDGINAVRMTIPVCHFDESECSEGIKTLKAYRKEWDEDRGTWRDAPRHDWASHGADAFRTLAMGWRDIIPQTINKTPHEKLQEAIAEMLKPRTYGDVLAEFEQEQEEA
jgi:hypothetical protein